MADDRLSMTHHDRLPAEIGHVGRHRDSCGSVAARARHAREVGQQPASPDPRAASRAQAGKAWTGSSGRSRRCSPSRSDAAVRKATSTTGPPAGSTCSRCSARSAWRSTSSAVTLGDRRAASAARASASPGSVGSRVTARASSSCAFASRACCSALSRSANAHTVSAVIAASAASAPTAITRSRRVRRRAAVRSSARALSPSCRTLQASTGSASTSWKISYRGEPPRSSTTGRSTRSAARWWSTGRTPSSATPA